MKKKVSKSSKKAKTDSTKPSAGAERSCTKKAKNNVLPHSESCPVKPHAIRNAIVKTPVVLAEEKVTICVDSKIKFPEPVLEIKAIKKNLKIVQCRLLAPTNKLFLRGFIRKNIQYATPIKVKHGAVQSEIHSLTVDIPFDTCVDITFFTEAQFHKNPESRQFTFLSETELPFGFSQKEKLMSADFSQFDQISGE
ncbi:CsxC family protein, partial [Microbacteriaceae bacterium 4G12]